MYPAHASSKLCEFISFEPFSFCQISKQICYYVAFPETAQVFGKGNFSYKVPADNNHHHLRCIFYRVPKKITFATPHPDPMIFIPAPAIPWFTLAYTGSPNHPWAISFFWVHTILNDILGFDTIITRYLQYFWFGKKCA